MLIQNFINFMFDCSYNSLCMWTKKLSTFCPRKLSLTQ
nr:MAG TPA: hypothetical protein [Caudoviricetes sp.]